MSSWVRPGRLRHATQGVRARSSSRSLGSIYALALLTLIGALSYTDRQLLGLMLPLIKGDLRLTDTSLGLITGLVFVLFYSALGLPIARSADRGNRRNILAAGLALWSLMTSLTGLAANLWQLAAARFLLGAGEAAGAAPSISMAADSFEERRRPLAMAVLSTNSSLAALLGLPVLGLVAMAYGWRAAFAAAGAAGLLLTVVFVITVREPARERGGAPADPGRGSTLDAARFLAGSQAYVYMVCGGAIVGISLYASQVWHPSFLARVHHLGIAQVGAAIGLPRGVAGLAGTLVGGVLADRLGRRSAFWRLAAPGLACILAMPAELVFLLSPHLPTALAGMLCYHLLLAMHFGPLYAACQSVARPGMRCTAIAVFLLTANLTGQVLGPLSVGYLNDRWAATMGPEAIRYSLLLESVCVLMGGGLMLAAARRLARDSERAAQPA